MSPEDIAAFRARLDAQGADGYVRGPTPPAPAPPPTKLDEALGRVRTYGGPIVDAAQTLGDIGNPMGPAMRAAGSAVVDKLGLGRRDTTSFTREQAPEAAPTQLRPMASGPDPTLPNTPTLASMAAKPTAGGSMGGGGSGGMGSLVRDYKQSQQNQFGAFNTEKDLTERRGELQSDEIEKTAQLQELAAAKKQRDAEVMAQHQAEVGKQHDAFLARNQQLTDDIGAMRVDPSKVLGDKSAGEKVGLLVSGLLTGFAGNGAQALARIDGMVDQGVRAQMANIDNKKAQLAGRQTIFGQMMAESGDRAVAEAQTRNLIYESIKQDIAAKSARLGIPSVMNNAELIMNGIEQQKQNPLQSQIAKDALVAAQQQAAAAAAAQRAAEDKAWNRGIQVTELGIKKDAQDLERDKFNAEEGKDGTGLGKAGRQAMALDQAKAQQELNANLRAVSAADPAKVAAGGSAGEAASHLPAWVPGVTGARENANTRDEYNSLVLPAIGAAWKMRTGGVEPKNPTILEEQAKPYKVLPSDNEEIVASKKAALRRHLASAADAQGADVPALPGSLKFSGGPPK